MDLSTQYLGLTLANPLVASASPLSMDLDAVRQMEDHGAGAVVLASLFEEQIAHDAEELEHYLHYGADRFAESLSYFPEAEEYRLGAEEYLDTIARIRQATDLPVIASLNGVSPKGWASYAGQLAQAGAHAMELNVYYVPTNPSLSAADVEDVYASALAAVKSALDPAIPVAMKLSPFFSNLSATVVRLDRDGADGFVLFNRFYQPDIDPIELEVTTKPRLSTSADGLLPLRWIAILHGKIEASLAAGGGVHTGADAAKMILAGADAVMMCSAILQNGPQHFDTVRQGLIRILETHGYGSLGEMKGVMDQRNCPEPSAYERGNYLKALTAYGPTATFE